MAHALASMEASSGHMAYVNIIWTHGYELSFGTTLAKVGLLVVENNSIRQTVGHFVHLYTDNHRILE